MILCDYAIDRYVRDEYFERLNSLSPVRRTVEMFDAEIELLTLEMREHDEIFGWFRFDGENRKFKSFDNCSADFTDIKIYGFSVSFYNAVHR